jgi:hypothetical protein
MMLPSPVGDNVAESAWRQRDVDVESCWRWCCRVMLGDGAAMATWSWRDEDAELC